MTADADDDRSMDWVDAARSVCLCDVGQTAYWAVVAVGGGGEERLLLASRADIGDTRHTYDPACTAAAHEQLGALPLEFVRRLTVSARTHRCGRRTCKGRPCRMRVEAAGQACEFHRLATDDERTKP